jgi:hypothetical protein
MLPEENADILKRELWIGKNAEGGGYLEELRKLPVGRKNNQCYGGKSTGFPSELKVDGLFPEPLCSLSDYQSG